jgi:hypothetical protein
LINIFQIFPLLKANLEVSLDGLFGLPVKYHDNKRRLIGGLKSDYDYFSILLKFRVLLTQIQNSGLNCFLR